jgi:putative DNA primase/helicase
MSLESNPDAKNSLLANIPGELKALTQWVVWKLVIRNEKPTKVPFNPQNGQEAATNDPKSWSSFNDAVDTFSNGGFAGVGFVFTAADPYTGIDLDHCRNSETGEIEPWAREIVDSLNSYTELSQSGTGLHILIKGKLPGKKHKKPVGGAGAIEMYDSGRYFATTGNLLAGAPVDINDRDEELATIYALKFGDAEPAHKTNAGPTVEQPAVPSGPGFNAATITGPVIPKDEDLLKHARAAKNGAEFKALFDTGDMSAYDGDHNRADLALCSKLVYWCGNDPDRINRLFRRSKLIRPKWDEPRPGGTYGSRTIAKALSASGEGTGPTEAQGKFMETTQKKRGIRKWQEIVDSEVDGVGYVVEGMIEEGGTSLLIARQKAGKSMLAGQMCIDVANGEPFLGTLETKKGRVLYLDFENRPHVLKARGKDLGQNRLLDDVYFASWDRIAERDLGLDGENFTRLKKAVSELKPALLIIDPLRLATSMDTNEARGAVQLLERASELLAIQPKMAILIIHHVKKNQDPKNGLKLRADPREWMDKVHGSQALLAHVETIIGFEQDEEDLFTLATVPRSSNSITWALEKASGSQRFVLADNESQLKTWPKTQQENWHKLPPDFSRSEGDDLINHSTLDRLIRKAMPLGMLQQDPVTKRYSKTTIEQSGLAGTSGIIIQNKEVISGTESGTRRDEVGLPAVPPVSEQSQLEFQV